MIHKDIANMLLEQLNMELHSGYLYMEFANYYESENLPGFAHWYMVQAAEEYDHAMRIRHGKAGRMFVLIKGQHLQAHLLGGPDQKQLIAAGAENNQGMFLSQNIRLH